MAGAIRIEEMFKRDRDMGDIINSGVVDGVATITIRNQRRLNALTVEMWNKIGDAFDELATMKDLRCVLIQGAGTAAFSSGADISEFESTRATRSQVAFFHEAIVGRALTAIRDCPVPVVAKIRGVCMGGGLEIASVCDIRLGDDTVRMGAPVGKLGFPLALGETEVLYKLMGPVGLAELLFEGRILTADEALKRGLITRLTTPGDLDDEVANSLLSICEGGMLAARSNKQQLRRLTYDSSPVSVEERMAVYAFAETDEYQSGYRRFLGRGKPVS